MGPHHSNSANISLVFTSLPGHRVNKGITSRVFRFDPKKNKWQISNTIEAYIVNLDVSFLGRKKFQSKLIGRCRASALKNYAHTYKCQKINFFEYSRVIHQKKRLEPLMNEQKSV